MRASDHIRHKYRVIYRAAIHVKRLGKPLDLLGGGIYKRVHHLRIIFVNINLLQSDRQPHVMQPLCHLVHLPPRNLFKCQLAQYPERHQLSMQVFMRRRQSGQGIVNPVCACIAAILGLKIQEG